MDKNAGFWIVGLVVVALGLIVKMALICDRLDMLDSRIFNAREESYGKSSDLSRDTHILYERVGTVGRALSPEARKICQEFGELMGGSGLPIIAYGAQFELVASCDGSNVDLDKIRDVILSKKAELYETCKTKCEPK